MSRLLPFYKYHGTGNDFIMVDQRRERYLKGDEQALIARLCHRHFGIGADGLILLQERDGYDFEMVYFNADGRPSSMCGNGARCTVAFANTLGIHKTNYHFLAPDGPHRARKRANGWIDIEMKPVVSVETGEGFYYLDTGSPHYVRFVPDIHKVDVVQEGQAVRYGERFRAKGTNVNFVTQTENRLNVATYERGVENETLSCGTGVTAAALAAAQEGNMPAGEHCSPVWTKGGQLEVCFEKESTGAFQHIWLCGPAQYVFQGDLDLAPLLTFI